MDCTLHRDWRCALRARLPPETQVRERDAAISATYAAWYRRHPAPKDEVLGEPLAAARSVSSCADFMRSESRWSADVTRICRGAWID